MKTKTNIRKSCYCLILVSIMLLLIGCTKELIVVEEVIINRTIYVNNTIYINDTIPCNQTEPEINITYDRSYTLSLIRQLKKYEKRQDEYFNDFNNSECLWELNKSEVELEECEEELCDNWNTSWC